MTTTQPDSPIKDFKSWQAHLSATIMELKFEHQKRSVIVDRHLGGVITIKRPKY